MSNRITKQARPKRKYKAIAKVGLNTFVKYRTNNPANFILFLNRKFPAPLWCNFYNSKTKKIVGSWGSKKGLILTEG